MSARVAFLRFVLPLLLLFTIAQAYGRPHSASGSVAAVALSGDAKAPTGNNSTDLIAESRGTIRTFYDNGKEETASRPHGRNRERFAPSDEATSLPDAIDVREMTPNRLLPHAFYDQAVASIEAIYPDGKIVESERFGEINEVKYAFVAYTEKKESNKLRLDFVATNYRRAYRLSLTVAYNELDGALAAVLDKALALLSVMDRSPRPKDWFKDNCVKLEDPFVDSEDKTTDCRVDRFGDIGTIEGTKYYFCLYRWVVSFSDDDGGASGIYDSRPYNNTAVVILGGPAGGDLIGPLFEFDNGGMMGISWFEEPHVVTNSYGNIMVIPERISGTGAGNNDRFFILKRGQWRRIDADSWRRDLAGRLPKDHSIWKGISIDIENMRFESPVWRKGDANCCPSGGDVSANLILSGDKLEIGEFRYSHEP